MLVEKMIKRLIDIAVSLMGIILLSPLLIILSIIIKSDSEGSAFFKQKRAGKDGKSFTIYKFRTMYSNTDSYARSPVDNNDVRITEVGKMLRKTSLDELPQLFNVLMGDMSIVGPRPLLECQAEEFNDFEKQRLIVKPGITGLAQINGRGSLSWDKKMEYDVEYVNNRSLLFDIKIAFKTIGSIIKREDVYEDEEAGWEKWNT
ncbi:sugar transferase [Wukongibacter baidiensis]|uniref:sugar transferase n=1 Tax=Wukongibacter baidiensis TaxID=1723361 RepID=UPI003D7F967A